MQINRKINSSLIQLNKILYPTNLKKINEMMLFDPINKVSTKLGSNLLKNQKHLYLTRYILCVQEEGGIHFTSGHILLKYQYFYRGR